MQGQKLWTQPTVMLQAALSLPERLTGGLTEPLTLPLRAKVVNCLLYTPSSSRCPMLICTLAWSFALISLLVHELQAAPLDEASGPEVNRQQVSTTHTTCGAGRDR